jgi:predicted permease
VACGLVFGAAPAVQLARVEPQFAIRAGTRTAGRSPLRNALMSIEAGLALLVLVTAAMFFRSFSETRDTDPGFRRDGVLLAAYDLTGRNADGAAARTFAARLLERVRALPGVDAAAIASAVPLDFHGLPLRTFTLEGRGSPEAPDRALSNLVTPGYFKTMGIALRRGTDFADLNDTVAPRQVIVNDEFVRRFAGGTESLGRRVQIRGGDYVIAGIVANSLYESFGEAPKPIVYLSYRDRPSGAGELHLRARAGRETLLGPDVERAVRAIDPTLPVYDVRTLSEHIEKNLFLRRIPARMFVVLGPLLLLLASIGIYAVVSYTVSHRTAEIGLRLALGATGARVVVQIVSDTLRVIGAGVAAAWLIAFGLAAHLAPAGLIELPIFLGVPAILMLVATFACWLPAYRAATLDAIDALRQE